LSSILTRSKAQESQRLLGILALTIAGLSALKFFAIMTGIEPSWADYLMVFVCGPLALAAIVVAARVIQKR